MTDRLDEHVEIDGFAYHGVEAGIDRADPIPGARASRAGNGGRRAALRGGQSADVADQVVAGMARHADVRDHHVGMPCSERSLRFEHGGRRHDARAMHFERLRQQCARRRIVIDDQQFHSRAR